MFIVGVGFVLISFLIGSVADMEGGGPLAFLQPKLIAVFLTVTGGLGIILSGLLDNPFAGSIVLFISIFGGLFIAGIIHRLVLIPLKKAQNTSAFDKQTTVGTAAKVISPILQNGYGKIRYSVSGSTVTGPAKSEDGGEIKNGEDVAIVYIEGGTYFVRKMFEPERAN